MLARTTTRRDPMNTTTRRTLSALTAGALTLGLSATALAAHPKHGKRYSGFTSEPPVIGFRAPVSFKVSADGTKLLSFQYASLGCFGAGGFKPGVSPFTGAFAFKGIGTIKVAKNGSFSIKNAKTPFKVAKQTTVTTSTIIGKFKTASTATGTISFGQKFSAPHEHGGACGPGKLSFTAKAG
jgi:hypothetical protein